MIVLIVRLRMHFRMVVSKIMTGYVLFSFHGGSIAWVSFLASDDTITDCFWEGMEWRPGSRL